jgi:carbonic anhydrase/acetyltransferase-like protein (isoleucine patch superfamily)
MSGPTIVPWNGILPTIHPTAFVAPTAVVIGDTHIGPESNIWFGCVLRGDINHIRVGARVNLQDGSVVHVSGNAPCEIGDGVSIGHMALVHGCTLEPGCFIGMKACVMDRAVVETGAMVGAGALVTPGKRVPTGELWAGSPASPMRAITEKDLAEFARVSASYAQRGAKYREILTAAAS